MLSQKYCHPHQNSAKSPTDKLKMHNNYFFMHLNIPHQLHQLHRLPSLTHNHSKNIVPIP